LPPGDTAICKTCTLLVDLSREHNCPGLTSSSEPPQTTSQREGIDFLRDYRSRLDCACEGLAITLGDIGIDEALDDEKLIDTASRKLKMMFDMLIAAGIHPDLLKAAVRS
jgi:hypothetical protein